MLIHRRLFGIMHYCVARSMRFCHSARAETTSASATNGPNALPKEPLRSSPVCGAIKI